MQKIISTNFHHDAGHGWLKISIPDFMKVHPQEISHFSYYDKNFVYLEEDCDATRFEAAAKIKGFELKVQREPYDGDSSPIRRKPRFRLSDIYFHARHDFGVHI